MGRRSQYITRTTIHGIDTCDVCKKDIQEVHDHPEFTSVNEPDVKYSLTASREYSEMDSHYEVCSLECLVKLAEQEMKYIK